MTFLDLVLWRVRQHTQDVWIPPIEWGQKDILDLCPNGFDQILQVLVLTNRTKAASKAITNWDGPTALLYLKNPNCPSPGRQLHRWRGHFVCLAWLVCFSESVGKVLTACLCYRKDILDLCPNGFDEILQVLVLKNKTKAASRARAGCGSNQ